MHYEFSVGTHSKYAVVPAGDRWRVIDRASGEPVSARTFGTSAIACAVGVACAIEERRPAAAA